MVSMEEELWTSLGLLSFLLVRGFIISIIPIYTEPARFDQFFSLESLRHKSCLAPLFAGMLCAFVLSYKYFKFHTHKSHNTMIFCILEKIIPHSSSESIR